MARVKTGLSRSERLLQKLERQEEEQIRKRLAAAGYMVDEVLMAFPLNKKAGRARLKVLLEYEELDKADPAADMTEIEYACRYHPCVVIDYVQYLIDEVGPPSAEEIPILRELFANNPDALKRFEILEKEWTKCLNELTD